MSHSRVPALLSFVALSALVFRYAAAQTTGATFGDVIHLGGTPSDVVLDEMRGRLYLVNAGANRVDVYSYLQKQVVGSVPVGSQPVAAAMATNGCWLYVSK